MIESYSFVQPSYLVKIHVTVLQCLAKLNFFLWGDNRAGIHIVEEFGEVTSLDIYQSHPTVLFLSFFFFGGKTV